MKRTVLIALALAAITFGVRAQEADPAPEPQDPNLVNGFKISPLEIGFGRPAECVADLKDAQGRFWRIGLSEKGAAHLLTVPSEQITSVEPMRAQQVDLYIGHAPPVRVSAQASGLGALLLLSGNADLIDRLLTADRLRLEWPEYTVALAYGNFEPVHAALKTCIESTQGSRGSRLDRIDATTMQDLIKSVQEEAQLFAGPPTEIAPWEETDSPAARYRFGPAGGVVMLVGYLNEAGLDAWTQQTLAVQKAQCPEPLALRELEVREEAIPVDAMRIVMTECKLNDTLMLSRFIVAMMHGAIGLNVTTEAVMPLDRREDLGTRVLAQSDALVEALAKKLKYGWPERIE